MRLSADSTSKQIQSTISDKLNRLGCMFRIFGRVKDLHSLDKKINSDERYGHTKFIQDFIGIRVVLYFNDDVNIVHEALSEIFTERKKDQSIDSMNEVTFKPVRYNLVYDVPNDINYELPKQFQNKVEKTFELQIRTVLSEGWHEVEHDFRYKHKDDWNNFSDESRMLNGVYASLETNEWTILKIFDKIAYGHYKAKNWEAMLRQKLRLRLLNTPLDNSIANFFCEDNELAKAFFRIDRATLMKELVSRSYDYPMNLTNLVMFANAIFVQSELIKQITPETFLEDINAN